jgi:hypothetical protein
MARHIFAAWLGLFLICCLTVGADEVRIEKRGDDPLNGESRKISFLIDGAGLSQDDLNVVLDQAIKAVVGLRPIQSFNVIVVQQTGILVLSNDGLIPATPENKRRVEAFTKQVKKCDRSGVVPALTRAFKDEPQLLYLLVHDNFPNNDAVLKKVGELNADRHTKIFPILFSPAEDHAALSDTLKSLANDSGGTYKVVNVKDLEDPPATTRPAEKSR